MTKALVQFIFFITLSGVALYFLATSSGCSQENFPPVNSHWELEVKEAKVNCVSMCEISGGWYHIYNYPTDACYCRKTDNITWKTYRIYEENGVYIETDAVGQVDLQLNK